MKTYNDYLCKGWSVFPVAGEVYAKDKEDYKTYKTPLVSWSTYQERFATPAEVVAWEKQWPGAWIGCATGPISKLFVVDIDGEEGMKSIESIDMPITRVAKTPRGFHYFFEWSQDLENYITTAQDILPGIDVRGKGGFIIVPS